MKGVITRVEHKPEEFPKGTGREKAITWLFIRGENKRRYVFKDPKFEPFCYFNRGLLNTQSFPEEIRKHEIVKFDNKSYVKVYTDLPKTLNKLKNIIGHKNVH